MIADVIEMEPPAVRVVEMSGVSADGWGDAVWQAIAPTLGPGIRVVELMVLHHGTTSQLGKRKYHVIVRLSFRARRLMAGAEPCPWRASNSACALCWNRVPTS